jgi:hypothetical protein
MTMEQFRQEFKIDHQFNVLGLPVLLTKDQNGGSLGWTDGKVLYISVPAFSEVMVKSNFTKEEMQTLLNAITYHESGHVLLSDFVLWKLFNEVIRADYPEGWPLVRFLANLLEDIRIEFYMGIEYPGLAPAFRKASKLLAQVPTIEGEDNCITALMRVLFLTLRFGLWNGDFETAAGECAHEYRPFITEVLDAEGIMILTYATRGQDSRSSIFGAMLLFEKLLKVSERFFEPETIQEVLRNLTPGTTVVVDKQVLKELEEQLPPDAFAELMQQLKEIYGNDFGPGGEHGLSSKGAGAGGLDVVTELEDFVFYQDTKTLYKHEIMQLRKQFERLARIWEEDRRRWGTPIEDELPQAYIWSLTRDIPAPRIFEGYKLHKPPMDLILLIDQSGSMSGAPGILAMRAAVVIAETVAPIIGENITLSIYTFGDKIRQVKGPQEAIHQGRYFPKPSGGTSIFASIESAANLVHPHMNPRAKKLLIVFTDSYNYDNPQGSRIVAKAKVTLAPLLVTAFSTVPEPDKDFTQHLDMFKSLASIEELPDAFSTFLYKLLENLSRTPTT